MATFGKTTDGSSQSSSSAPRLWVSQATPSTSGTVVTGHARVRLTAAGSTSVVFAIYADDDGAPGALLAESDPLTLTSTTAGERTFTFTGDDAIAVAAGTPYWIGPAWNDPGDPQVEVRRDGTDFGRWEQTITPGPTLPDPFGTGTANNTGPLAAYVTYDETPPHDTIRLYTTTAPADTIPTDGPMSFWGATPSAATDEPLLLGNAPAGTADERAAAETSTTDGFLTLVQQWVSGPALADGQILEIDWTMMIAAFASSAAADMHLAVGAWIMAADGTRKTDLVGVAGNDVPANEWPAGVDRDDALVRGIITTFPAGSLLPQDIAADERLVLELGHRAWNTDGTSYTGTLLIGGTATPDLDPADTPPNLDRPSWLDIAVTPGLAFGEPDYGVAGTAAADLGFTAAAAGRRNMPGAAAADLGFTAAAAGTVVPVVRGTAAAALGFTAAAAGSPVPPVPGTAAAALGFTAAATGTVLAPGRGTAAGALGFAAAATGRRNLTGTAAAGLGFAAAARSRRRTGTAAAALGFAAAATGEAIGNITGTAAAALGFAAAATGTAQSGPHGTAAADLGFTAAAAGTRVANIGVPFLVDEFGGSAKLCVEIAWGADPSGSPDDWTWTDITRDVYADPGISTKVGRDDEASTSQPASCSMVLRNDEQAYSLGGHSPNWPNVRRNVPVRFRIDPDGDGFALVFIGHADGFTPGWITTGGIPTVTLSASGTMRRILQGDAPVTSAYRRAMTELNSVVAYWPFEEGHNATYARAVRGGSDMVTATDSHEFDAESPFDCSAPLVRLRSSPAGTFEDFGASVDPYGVTGETQVRFLMSIPRNGLPNGAFLCDIFTNGSAARFSLTYWDGINIGTGVEDPLGELDGLHFTIWDDNNDVLHEELQIGFPVLGASLRFSVELVQNGSDINWTFATLAPGDDTAFFRDGTLEDETVGRVTSIFVGGNDVDDAILGHVTLQNQVTDFFEQDDPLAAHVGEFSTGDGRLFRLGRENGVRTRVLGSTANISPNETLGPQLARPLMELLRECETADQGQLFDGMFVPGLVYTTRRFRELGTVAVTIDAAAADLAAPWEPVDDDQRNRNRVEATITTGVTATFEDVAGPLGTDTIGIYDSSVEVNNQHDDMAIHYAAWLVHTGTVDGYRVGSVTIDLRAAPELARAVLEALPGHRIDITNVDQVFDGWLPGDIPLSLIIEGISHEIGPRHWRVTFRCSPFSPWGVAQAAAETGDTNPFAWRLDTDGTRLVGDHPAGSTSLVVSNEPAVLAADTFTRTVSNGWGTADAGGPYTVAGTTGAQLSDFAVGSGVATIAVQAANRAQWAFLDDVDVRDVDVAVTCTCSATDITGGQIELADVMVRGRSTEDYFYARVVVLANQTVFLSIVEVADGTHNELIQPLQVPGLTFAGTLRCRMQAVGHTLRARVWNPSGAEPTDWQREVTVTAARSGWVGTRVAIANGVTNAMPLTFSHDTFTAATVEPAGGPLWTTDADDYPMTLSVGGIPVVATACSGASSPQTFTVDPLPLDRADGVPVALWDPRPIGL